MTFFLIQSAILNKTRRIKQRNLKKSW